MIAGLDLAIAPGEVVALTGSNGIGKSTLIRLLLRFYDPQGGRITLDGADIADLQVQSLRRQFGYVPQRPLLIDATVRENINLESAIAALKGRTVIIITHRPASLAMADRIIDLDEAKVVSRATRAFG